ncbi:EAL domain-containing protein [Acidovorax sp. NCPPB 2350]|nr:EAL domain-containing protein [Acidovorax sp. NCPPB 2350]
MPTDPGFPYLVQLALVAVLAALPARWLAPSMARPKGFAPLAGLAAGLASCAALVADPLADSAPTAAVALCFGPLAGAVSGLAAAIGSAARHPASGWVAAGMLACAWALGVAWGRLRHGRRPAGPWLATGGLALTLPPALVAWTGEFPWRDLAGVLVLCGGAQLVLARARAAQALRRREADLQATLDATGGGRWEWNVPERRPTFRGRFYETFGLAGCEGDTAAPDGAPPATSAVQRWAECRHPEDAERIATHMQRALEGHEDTIAAEYRMRDIHGRWRWVISRGQVAERDAQGRAVRLVGVHLDATALHEVRDAVRLAEEQRSTVYQMLPDAAAITRAEDGRYLDVNPAFTEFFGIARCDAIGRTSVELGIWPDPQERERMLERLRQEGQIEKLPMRAARGTQRIPGLFSARSVRMGGEDCLISVFQDTSETQRTHDRLAAAHGLLLQAGRMARLGVWEHVRGEGLVYWSDVCFDIHGVPRGTPLPRPEEYMRDHVAEPFRAALWEHFRAGQERGTDWSMEVQILRADDGRAVWVRVHAEPVTEGGEVTGMRGVMQDIDESRRAAERLNQSEDRFMRIFELMPYPVVLSRRDDGAYIAVNTAWEALLGIPREEALGRTAVELGIFTHQARERLIGSVQDDEAARQNQELALQTRGNGVRTVLQSMHAADLDGVPVWLLSAHDITERKHDEDRIREREELLSLTLSAASLGLWDWDLQTGQLSGDARWRELQGLPPPAGGPAPRVHWTSGMAPADIDNVSTELERHLAHPGTHFDATWHVAASASANPPASPPAAGGAPTGRWVRNLGKIVDHDDRGRPARMLGVAIDVTSQRVQEDLLHQLAHFDALTGLPNRVQLARRLEQAMAQAGARERLLGVAYLDLDGFKPVNDRLGHSAGDRLLVVVAGRLTRALRPIDCVARLGGDEFVILLPDLRTRSEVELLLARLMESLSAPYTLGTERVTVTASVGYTLYPEDGADADTLLRHADHAMYGAKQGGRNRVQAFDAAQERDREARREQAERMREALAQGEFMLYLQPKVDMRAGTVVGAEALARWNHPERGVLAPGAFLPLIESAELEIAFGEWVVDTALELIATLRKGGLELPVSVNISARHLQQEGFAGWLAGRMAQRPGIPARLLDMEITESAALYDIDHVAPQLWQLRELGVTVSLDDFGTGYSSLSYLRRLPMDTLKLDQSFVHGMMNDRGDFAIVQGVIGLARSFGYSIVAEGVETEAQGLTLLRLGCALAQGYCVSRPMPAQDFPGWVAGWRAPDAWRRAAPA